MIDEDVIAAQVRWNIPAKDEPSSPTPPGTLTGEQSSITPDRTNELALMKLANELGVMNPSSDAQKQLAFIYEQIQAVAPDASYEKVLETLDDYMIRLGFKFAPDRFMRLYLWLKMNRERLALDKEMARLQRG